MQVDNAYIYGHTSERGRGWGETTTRGGDRRRRTYRASVVWAYWQTNDRVEQRPDRHVVTWSCDGPFPARRRAAAKARATAFNPGGTGRSDWLRNRPIGRRHASISGKRNDQVYLPPVLFGSSRRWFLVRARQRQWRKISPRGSRSPPFGKVISLIYLRPYISRFEYFFRLSREYIIYIIKFSWNFARDI